MRPSWLVVEKAIIFLMSCCTVAVDAANRAVIAPNTRITFCKNGLFLMSGEIRISKNTPATTIVDLCSRAETGVGPSMAAGNHGCNPNCADFPVAAMRQPIIKRDTIVGDDWVSIKSESNVHVEVVKIIHPAARSIPMSPRRLYIIACKAAVLASDRVNHHPISRNDRKPTPSQPISN